MLKLSQASGVMLRSESQHSKGSGVFIGDQLVLTCNHVVSNTTIENSTIHWVPHADLQVILPSGEAIGGTVVSVPTQAEMSPIKNDFALVKLKSKPKNSFSIVQLASDNELPSVGDDVVFSGYPLGTPGMVTHRGMVSGFDSSSSLIFVQASINKGNSGGALLNSQGHVVGIVSMREGGISQGLLNLQQHIDQTASQGSMTVMGVDPLQAIRETIRTLDTHISTGIGYARSIKFARRYMEENPGLLE